MATVSELLASTEKTLFSFEVLPPLRGQNLNKIYDTINRLMKFSPAFIEVTTHRSNFTYREISSGNYKRVEERLRPGTVAIAYAIKQKYNVPVVPHVICSGYSKSDTENELLDLAFLEMFDLLVLRGDKSKEDSRFIPKEGGLTYASELCQQINEFNNGHMIYGDHEMLEPGRRFSYGVAGYPEKHEEAMSLSLDLDALKRKIDLGAGYVVTQMFFNNNAYFDFVEKCRKAGINVPIVPGLKPLSTLNHRVMLPRTFHIDFPDELAEKLQRCQTNDDVRKLGLEWCIKQSQELYDAGVPCLHYYTMNAAPTIEAVAAQIFNS